MLFQGTHQCKQLFSLGCFEGVFQFLTGFSLSDDQAEVEATKQKKWTASQTREFSDLHCLLAYLVLPDILFYIKLITELIHWDSADPGWATADWSCGLWQFATHLYPLAYSLTLTAILYHAFITLYMDYKGDYEASCRKYLPLLLIALSFLLSVICASSGFYSRAKTSSSLERSDGRQHCDLAVPSIVGADTSAEVAEISRVTYRLVYEIVLPYLVPLVLVAFPYVALLVGKISH